MSPLFTWLLAAALTGLPLSDLQDRAAHGDAEAQHELGQRLYFGDGPKAEALAWELEAAAQGYLPAYWDVADMYYWCQELHDDAKAIEWFKRGAEHGNASCQNRLATLLLDGDIVEKDAPAAVGWLRKAVEQGHKEAIANLGWCLVTGNGVAADPRTGLAMIQQSAELGCPFAARYLMVAYHDGLGVPVDPEQSYFWGVVNLRGFDSDLIPTRAQLPPDKQKALWKQANDWIEAHPI